MHVVHQESRISLNLVFCTIASSCFCSLIPFRAYVENILRRCLASGTRTNANSQALVRLKQTCLTGVVLVHHARRRGLSQGVLRQRLSNYYSHEAREKGNQTPMRGDHHLHPITPHVNLNRSQNRTRLFLEVQQFWPRRLTHRFSYPTSNKDLNPSALK